MKRKLEQALQKSLEQAIAQNEIELTAFPEIVLERARDKQFGDYASNLAMSLAKEAKKNPRQIAEVLIKHFPKTAEIKDVQIAGPGFMNFYIHDAAYHDVVKDILRTDGVYGFSSIGQGKRIIVEFVSSNPTGPLHVGHGRHAAYGATVSNLLEAVGYKVHREYYINDAGRQMQILAASVWLRYLELFSEKITFPVNGYKGDYITDIAKQLKVKYENQFLQKASEVFQNLPQDEDGNGNGDKEAYIDAVISRAKELIGKDNFHLIFEFSLKAILADIKQDLEEFGVTFQEWFHESSLVNGDIERGLQRLRDNNCLYERDGAIWFRATSYGDEKDRVVIRDNGQSTYFASDVGYHFNKYERDFDVILDIFGSDHHGYAPRIRAFLQAANEDLDKFKIKLVQFAVLYRGKEKLAMSTRSGTFVTLRELRKEVGNDAARFFYIMRKSDQHLDFDLELAKSHSSENPVYYIQYAHARIASVMRLLSHQKLSWDKDSGLANLSLLNTAHEENILRCLAQFPEILENAALNYEPHVLAHYLLDLANNFHTYYNAYKFIVEDDNLRNARLCLISATQTVLANSLKLLGVSTPDVM